MYAIVPSISFNNGDLRRNTQPYFIALGITYADLNTANSAMRFLNGKGIRCHLEVIV